MQWQILKTKPRLTRWVLLGAGLASLGAAVVGCGSDDDSGGSGGTSAGGSPAGGTSAGGAMSGGTGGLGLGGGTGGATTGGSTSSGSGSIIDCEGAYDGMPATCGEALTRAAIKPINVLMVLDKSASMGLAGKWEKTMAAVNDALVDLAPFANFGLILYPAASVGEDCYTIDRSTCCSVADAPDVPLGPGNTTAPQIAEALCGSDGECNSDDDPTGPAGWTPTAHALGLAHDYLDSFLEGGDPDTETLVFLVTDGGPNCDSTTECGEAECTANIDNSAFDGYNQCIAGDPNFPGPLQCVDVDTDGDGPITTVQSLDAIGVKTVVVGIPGSDQPEYVGILNQMAIAGGNPQVGGETDYYQVGEDQEAIKRVFVSVAAELITSCDIELEEPPVDPELAIVAVECQVVEPTDATGATQWTLEVTDDGATLHLLGDLCTRAQEEGLGSVDVLYGCGYT